MKKIVSVFLAILMAMSFLTAINASAATFVPEKVTIEKAEYNRCTSSSAVECKNTLYDGITGNNKTSDCSKSLMDKTLFTKVAKSGIAHGETVTSDTYSWPVVDPTTLTPAKLTLDNQTELEYLYNLTITLKDAAAVGSVNFYLHGYKPGVLDRTFYILVSSDGQTWKKVYSAGVQTPMVDETTGLLTKEGQQVYSGAINTPGGAASDADATACVSVSFDTVENVKYVMWACSATRFNNSYYSARFTEAEIYTGEVKQNPPQTADNLVYFAVAAAAVGMAATIVVIKKKED